MPDLSSFLSMLKQSDSVALTDDTGSSYTYKQLIGSANRWSRVFKSDEKKLVFHFIENTTCDTLAFLGALESSNAVALLDTQLSVKARQALIELYQPDFIISDETNVFKHDEYELFDFEGLTISKRKMEQKTDFIHNDVALLLSTSGSTGSPKFVKLTLNNIISNASSISKSLEIVASEIACGHLKLHYSYGLSILTSFLLRGAQVALTKLSFIDKEFWKELNTRKISHLPGVPFHYQMIYRLGFDRLRLDQLTVMTQAGGILELEIKKTAHEFMSRRNGRFYVMYGQTEASPRITILPHSDFQEHSETVGLVLSQGQLEIRDDDHNLLPNGQIGHIYYKGPNVMMGYADKRDDLTHGAMNDGYLDTGDTGYLKHGKYLVITGRTKRVGKINGLRVNLDEIEQCVGTFTSCAVIQLDNHIIICVPETNDDIINALLDELVSIFTLPLQVYQVVSVGDIPLTSRNKVDYKTLERDLSDV